jgi:choline dehydrogenase-like flavoprotein
LKDCSTFVADAKKHSLIHCVIGSGPAGTACTKALLARGADVLMLDAGIELEIDRAKIVRELGAMKPSQWPPQRIAILKNGMSATGKGILKKLAFGSDYPYRDAEQHAPWRGDGASVLPSLALGGFSTVWGAAMLPYRDDDLESWPVKSSDLQSHYRAVLQFTGLAAQRDSLEELFPLYCNNSGKLQLSQQASSLLQNLERNRAELNKSGWRFGRARLALRTEDDSKGAGCVYCGMCLYGCPYGCIYNSADTVSEMRSQKNFNYQRDVIVTRLRENSEKVFIEAYNRQTRAPFSFEARRVYLGAGIVPTTEILLRSQNAYDRLLRTCDSQYFIFPLLLARRARGARNEAAYTLSQLFIELNNPQISPRTVHVQIYTFNEIVAEAIRKSLGPLKCFAPPLEERVLVGQGYLHSDDSPEIEMTLKRDGERDYLQLRVHENPKTHRIVKKVLREFARQSRRLGAIPLAPLLQLTLPGRGFHSGGTFPMRARPGEFESDCLGRPHGWSRVHAVDASVFPSVPATTITLPVMANAHRIGAEKLD